jgi:hypothetical protein
MLAKGAAMKKGLLTDVMPVEMWPYKQDGEIKYTGCKQCSIMLDDDARYGEHERLDSRDE